jgi:hypothetical protein
MLAAFHRLWSLLDLGNGPFAYANRHQKNSRGDDDPDCNGHAL